MEENNQIDDLFRSAIESFEMEPSAQATDLFKAELDKKRQAKMRRRRLGYFFASVVLLFLSYTAIRYFGKEPVTAPDKIIPAESQLQQKSTVPEAKINTTQTTHVTEMEHSAVPIHNQSNVNNAVSQSPAKVQIEKSAPENKVSTPEIPVVSIPKNNIPSSVHKTTNEAHQAESNLPVESMNEKYVQRDESKKTPAENAKDASGELTSANETKNEPVKEVAYSLNPPVMPSHLDNKQNDAGSANNSFLIKPTTSAQENQATETKNPEDPKSGDDVLNKQSAETKQQENSPSTNAAAPAENTSADNAQSNSMGSASLLKRALSHLSVEIYFSPDEASSRLKPNYSYNGTASRNPDDYANPKTQFSYSTGLNVGYDLGKNWSVISGIAFSTFSQTAVYNTIQVIADSVYKEQHGHGPHGHGHGHGGNHNHNPPNPGNDHHYVIHTPCGAIDLHNEPPHPHGQPHPENGESINIKTEVSETIHFFYVPLLVRYQFGKSKLSYLVEGGGAINFVSKDKINVVVNDAYSESNNLDGLNSMNYSLLIGAGVRYNFYKGLSTFLKPSFRYSVSPINQDNPIYSYPYYFGLGAGLTIHF